MLLGGAHADVGLASRFSLPIRNTRPQMRCASVPSDVPTLMIRSLISRSSTPVLTISGASASNSSSAGTTAPSGRSETLRDGVVDDAQLRAQLAVRAGRVDLPEAVLPEAAAHRQQRIVVDDDRAVLDGLPDRACPAAAARPRRRVARAACEPAAVAAGFFCSSTLRVTGSTSASDSGTRIVKRSISFCSNGTSVSALWPAPHDHHLAVELLRDSLGHLGDEHRAIVGVADVLLHLVENEQRAGHATDRRPRSFSASFAMRRNSSVVMSVLRRRKLRLQQLLRLGLRFDAKLGSHAITALAIGPLT